MPEKLNTIYHLILEQGKADGKWKKNFLLLCLPGDCSWYYQKFSI